MRCSPGPCEYERYEPWQSSEHDTRLWHLVNHHVEEATFADVTSFCVDETAGKRGHNHVSVFVDLHTHKVLYATEGRDTPARFKEDFAAHGGDFAKVKELCCDMSPVFPFRR